MRNHSERIEVQLTLLSVPHAEDNELQIVFSVTASATVREIGHTISEPGEILVEDIEIDEVRLMSMHFGQFGAMWPAETPVKSMVAMENQRRVDWLNSQLSDRDDWTDAISRAVIACVRVRLGNNTKAGPRRDSLSCP